ncbi:natural resistance-associated macrophage protein-domain-containing protein [Phycomyces blakesleeanus]
MKNIFKSVSSYIRVLLKFLGPGFMVAVGYLDPGNWATDMQGGSQYGYRLLFIILISNLVAIFLQNLTIRLGTISGLDLAAASRRFFPTWVNLILYVLAEAAIIAEVIGSAIALNLLFPNLPLQVGVAITATDVLIVLLFYNDEPDSDGDQMQSTSARIVNYFEIFVMLLVVVVGVCFVVELAYSDIVAKDVFRGFLPSKEIFTDPSCLYSAIGIIGATVMPHNLYLHSFITQGRCQEWRGRRPRVVKDEAGVWVVKSPEKYVCKEGDEDNLDARRRKVARDIKNAKNKKQPFPSEKEQVSAVISDKDQITIDLDIEPIEDRVDIEYLSRYININMRKNLHYGLVDLIFALCFAFFVNCAILMVASANFYYAPEAQRHTVEDLFSAHELLYRYIGPPAAVIFALALLCAGQSSTLTTTLAGQVIMSGFLGMSSRPWVRRIITRLVAIVPAMVAASLAGRNGLSTMLVASQVALSVQLPFAVIPLIIFTSMKRCMKLDLVVEYRGDIKKQRTQNGFDRAIALWRDQMIHIFHPSKLSQMITFMLDSIHTAKKLTKQDIADKSGIGIGIDIAIDENIPLPIVIAEETQPAVRLDEWPASIVKTNGKYTNTIAIILSLILIGLNVYMIVALGLGI